MTQAAAPLLQTVATFRDPYTALLARTALESEDIPTRMHSLEHVMLQWTISNAIGGVQLLVPSSEVERAKARLAENHHVDLDMIEEIHLPLEDRDICPQCDSENIRADSLERTTKCLALLVTMLIVPLPFAMGRFFWRCEDCGHSFHDTDYQRHWAVIAFVHPIAISWSALVWLKSHLFNLVGLRQLRSILFGSKLACWACGENFSSDDTTCPACETVLPTAALYQKYVIPGHSYESACTTCHLPYSQADYGPHADSWRCSGCGNVVGP